MNMVLLHEALMDYVSQGNIEKVQELLDDINDINKVLYNGHAMLHYAAENGRYKIVELLISKGHNINWRAQSTGASPMHYAVKNGHFKIVKILMLNGADINALDDNGKSPLHYAAEQGHTKIADYLLSKGHSKLVAMILRNGAEINFKDDFGKTPLHYAAIGGHTEFVKLLISNKYNNMTGKLITKGVEIDSEDMTGYTPLMYASEKGYIDVVEALISKGANLNLVNDLGDNALMLASKNGYTNVVELLLENNIDYKISNNTGDTPLIVAARNGHTDIIKVLLKLGIDLEQKNFDECDAFITAVSNGNTRVVSTLLEKGVNCKKQNDTGDTALIIASRNGHIEIVKFLIDAGVSLEDKNKKGENAFSVAAKGGYDNVLRVLLESGVEFLRDKNIAEKALIDAAEGGHIETVKLLVNLGVDVNVIDDQGNTPLHLAANNGFDKTVKYLLDNVATVDAKNLKGETPLHKAASHGKSTKTVSHLLEKGANIEEQDNFEKTPFTIASSVTQFNVFETILRNDPENISLKNAIDTANKNMKTPDLAKILSESKIDSPRKRKSIHNLNTSKKLSTALRRYSVGSILRKNNWLETEEQNFMNLTYEILSDSKEYRLLLLTLWIAANFFNKEKGAKNLTAEHLKYYGDRLDLLKLLKTNENIVEFFNKKEGNLNEEYNFIDEITELDVERESINSNYLVQICYLMQDEIRAGNNKLYGLEQKNNSEIFILDEIINKFDTITAPIMEYDLLINDSTKYINMSSYLYQRLKKLNSLRISPAEEKIRKYKSYETKIQKLSNDEQYIYLSQIKSILYRYLALRNKGRQISEILFLNQGTDEKLLRYKNMSVDIREEINSLEGKYNFLAKDGYKKHIKKYEELKGKIEVCTTCMNFIDFLNEHIHF